MKIKISKNIIFLIAGSVIFSILLIEIFLQITGLPRTPMDDYREHIFIPDDVLGLKYMPNAHARYTRCDFDNIVTTNSFGFRDREFNIEKQPGRTRIAVLGDSFTSGDESPIPEIWVKVLEAELLKNGEDIEIMNFGIASTSTVYHYRLLEHVVRQFSPNYVIVAFNGNDFNYEDIFFAGVEPFAFFTCTTYENTDVLYTDNESLQTGLEMLNWYKQRPLAVFMLEHIGIARLFKKAFNNWLRNRYWPKSGMYIFYSQEALDRITYEQKFDVTTEYILKLKNFCDSQDQKLIFLLMPGLRSNDFYYKDIRPFLKKKGILVIDVDREFNQRLSRIKRRFFFPFDEHPNRKGHSEIGEIVCRELLNRIL